MTQYHPIKRLLIANRGEIAVRIIQDRPGASAFTPSPSIRTRTPTPCTCGKRTRPGTWGPAPPGRATRCRQGASIARGRAPTPCTRATVSCRGEQRLRHRHREQRGLRSLSAKRRRHPRHGDKSGAKALMEAGRRARAPGYHGADQRPVVLRDQATLVGFPLLIGPPVAAAARGCAGSISRMSLT